MSSYYSFAAIQYRNNSIELNSYLRQAPESNKATINELTKLYEDKKI
jgi:hypothetical protein